MLSAIFIGLGFSSRAEAPEIVELVSALRAEAPPHVSAQIFTLARKRDSGALAEAAQLLALPVKFCDEAELLAREPELLARGVTPSKNLRAKTGLFSVAEAAALVGGGPGAVLIAPRRAENHVTCALAALSEEMSR